MEPERLARLINDFLPTLVTAGAYGLATQGKARERAAKTSSNAWKAALTDTDLGIQHYLEVETLAHPLELGFYGEESEHSPNAAYFPAEAETWLHLDPVNGTYPYQQGRDSWDIILSVSYQRRLQAVVSYMPARRRFFLAAEGLGALTGTAEAPELSAMQTLSIPTGRGACLTYQTPQLIPRLPDKLRAYDIVKDDAPEQHPDYLNAIFGEQLDAFLCTGGDMLDWGALAFVVAAAGGVATHLNGESISQFDDFEPTETTDLLVAGSRELHSDLLEAING